MENNRHLEGGVINVAGAQSHIGTTTQCLQLVKFLQRAGYNAAYIECNYQNYIASVYEMNISVNPYVPNTKVECFGVDMYPWSKLYDFMDGSSKYDYLVCDYGNVGIDKFNKEEFLKGDARILVGGFEPNERLELTRCLMDDDLQNSIFMLSFIDKSIEPYVREQMAEYESRTFCAPYTPDPFGEYTLQDNDMWPKVMYWVHELMNSRRPNLKVVD